MLKNRSYARGQRPGLRSDIPDARDARECSCRPAFIAFEAGERDEAPMREAIVGIRSVVGTAYGATAFLPGSARGGNR